MGMYPEPFTGIADDLDSSSFDFLPGSPPGSSVGSPPAPPHATDNNYHYENKYGILTKRLF